MFSIPVARPFGVTVQPQAVITAARASSSASTRLPADSLRHSSHQALQMPSLVEGLGEGEQKRCRLPASPLSSTGQDFFRRGQWWLAKDDPPPRCLHHPPTRGGCLFSPSSLQLKPPPPSPASSHQRALCCASRSYWGRHYKLSFHSCCRPLGTAQKSLSPSTLSKFNTEKNIWLFSPMKSSPPALTFIPTPSSALPWGFACSYRKTFTVKEISGGGEGNTGASIHPDSCSCSTSNQYRFCFPLSLHMLITQQRLE